MALEKKYDETPLQVLTSKIMRGRVKRLARVTGLSQAAVIREILDVGVPIMEDLHGISDDLGD